MGNNSYHTKLEAEELLQFKECGSGDVASPKYVSPKIYFSLLYVILLDTIDSQAGSLLDSQVRSFLGGKKYDIIN